MIPARLAHPSIPRIWEQLARSYQSPDIIRLYLSPGDLTDCPSEQKPSGLTEANFPLLINPVLMECIAKESQRKRMQTQSNNSNDVARRYRINYCVSSY